MATFFASIFHSPMNEFNWIKLILTPRGRLLSTIGSEEMLGKGSTDCWERGRPVRTTPEARSLFVLRAQCGRDARAPSITLRLTGLAATLSVFIHRGIPI